VVLSRASLAVLIGASTPAVAQEEMPELLYYMVRGEIDASESDDDTLITWDGEAWAGYGDQYRLWLKSEGEVHDGDTEEGEVQLLFSSAISEFWNLQGGVRYDWEPSSLAYAVLGVEGLAPYFFETEAALFLSEDGDLSARLEQSLDVLLTQSLIATPHAELEVYADDVPERRVGAGFSRIEAGVQIRYEITRKFAPYIDVVYERALGETSILARASGDDVEDVTVRGGIRFWF
jgi:copper resistance protein B